MAYNFPSNPQNNDTYLQFTYNSTIGAWTIPAAVGPQGPKGDTGATGAAGSNGADGKFIIQDTKPTTGLTAGVTWVNTSDGRTYVYTGAEWFETYNNFIGPQGAQGIQGIQGPSGTTSVTAPITNTGTSQAAVLGLDYNVVDTRYAKLSATQSFVGTQTISPKYANEKGLIVKAASTLQATITAATGNGTTVTYTAANSFSAGQTVSIIGLGVNSGTSLNLTSVTIATASSTNFTVTNATVGVSVGTGTATAQATQSVFIQEWQNAAGTSIGSMDYAGNFIAAGDITTQSDARVKENVAPIENALQKVLELNGVTYTLIDWPEQGTHVGLIAQDVEAVVPEAVRETGDVKSVAYANLIGLLVEAIKDQQAQIEELKVKVNGL
jgi:phosphotransferase system HPr-like phosphotransfer protein